MVAGVLLAISVSLGGSNPRCDAVEINHYCPDGREQFVQAIAWDYDHQIQQYTVQQWVFVRSWSVVPGGVVLVTSEREKQVKIRCACVSETWSRNDPERDNQLIFPCSERRQVW